MKLFISYRRDDSQHQADRLHQALQHVVPKKNLFIDIDGIPAGVDFIQHISDQVGQCDILLALIGPDWLAAADPQGRRRLDDPSDFVRVEIATALNRGITVAPVLLDHAPMPLPDQLPADIAELSRRNAVDVRRNSFDADAKRLIHKLGLGRRPGAIFRWGVSVVATLLLLGMAVWWAFIESRRNTDSIPSGRAIVPSVATVCVDCPAVTARSLPGGAMLDASEPISLRHWQIYCAEVACKDEPDADRQGVHATLISWSMANRYSLWLSQKTGHPYRLPTVEEVEALHAGAKPVADAAFSEWTNTCHGPADVPACAFYEVRGWNRQGEVLQDWHTPDSRGKSIGFRVVANH